MKHIRLLALTAGLFAAVPGVPSLAAPDAPTAWANTVNSLTSSLTQRISSEVLRTAFAEQYTSRKLDGTTASLEDLSAVLANVDWVEQLSYKTTPDTLAADIAAAVQSSSLPEGLKRYLSPSGEQPERTANVTAMKWIGKQLRARADQPVGVILAHVPAEPSTAAASPLGRVIVILVAGELVGREQYRFKQIAFGEFSPAK